MCQKFPTNVFSRIHRVAFRCNINVYMFYARKLMIDTQKYLHSGEKEGEREILVLLPQGFSCAHAK